MYICIYNIYRQSFYINIYIYIYNFTIKCNSQTILPLERR